MARLFNRAVRVVIGTVEVRDLRVTFRVTKTSGKDPNTAEVKVYNLSPEHRATFQSKGTPILVEAGYQNTSSVLFTGDSRTIDSVYDKADFITKVECGDGEKNYQLAQCSESFRPGTSVADVFAKLASLSGHIVGDSVSTVRAATSAQFASGYAVHGKVSSEIDRLLSKRGLKWSVQNGVLQVLGPKQTTNESTVVLDGDRGLVGSPEHGSPDKKGAAPKLKVKSLLNPLLKPGRKVQVISERNNGVYRIEKVDHNGDTHSGDWYSVCEVVAV